MNITNTKQFSTFYLDGLLFGVESQEIQEVLRAVELTEVPLAAEVIAGLMNLRGQIVAAIDLRGRLKLEKRAADTATAVVIHTSEGPVALMVDDIGDVVEVNDATFERAPETLKEAVRGIVTGVHKLEGQLMHVVNTSRVCEISGTS